MQDEFKANISRFLFFLSNFKLVKDFESLIHNLSNMTAKFKLFGYALYLTLP